MNTATEQESIEETEAPALEADTRFLRIKSISLMVLAIVAVVYVLDWAQDFFVTMLLGIFSAYILNPVVSGLEKIRIPRVVGASITVVMVIIALSLSALALRGQVESIINELPNVSKKVTSLVSTKKGEPLSNIQKVQIVASQVEKVTNATDTGAGKRKEVQVVLKEQKFKLSDFLWKGSLGFVGAIAGFITVMFLAYFLLISGDTFKRKLVKLAGPNMSSKKITVNILQDINQSIQGYIFMLLVTNILVGIFMWVALYFLELKNAGAWAVVSGLIHFIPYFGPILTALATGMAAFMQFDSLSMAFLVAGVSIVIATIVGVFITTWMTGRIAKMNSAAIFTSLIFFTWIWGVWGVLLGIPVIVIVKVIADRIEQLSPVAEILGD